MVLKCGGSPSWREGECVYTDGAQYLPTGGGDGHDDQGALRLEEGKEGGREGGKKMENIWRGEEEKEEGLRAH